MRARTLSILSCPVHRADMREVSGRLICGAGHEIAVEESVPVLAQKPRREPKPLNMAPLPGERQGAVDPFVDDWIVNTNGNLYWRARGRLTRYPIPRWPAAHVNGDRNECSVLVDLGCSWGRWSIAAARAGFSVCGVDVHLDALWAATRVARELEAEADFVCGDLVRLPFRSATVDFVFSYSVLQHLDKERVRQVLKEIARILRPAGTCLVQLPNARGVMSFMRQAWRGFREPPLDTFEMRYWTRARIAEAFTEAGLGPVRVSAEGFLLQNTQREDLDLLSPAGGAAVLASCALRATANVLPVLSRMADSVWIIATKAANTSLAQKSAGKN